MHMYMCTCASMCMCFACAHLCVEMCVHVYEHTCPNVHGHGVPTSALFGVLGLKTIQKEDKQFAGWVHFTDELEDVAHIPPHVVFGVTNLTNQDTYYRM